MPINNPPASIENSTIILQTATDNNLLKQSLNLISSLHMNITFKDDSIDDDDNDDDFNFDEPLLNENDLMFNLQPPSMVPAYLNYHYVCECGSRLLFMSIYWMKRIHIFKMLRYFCETRKFAKITFLTFIISQ